MLFISASSLPSQTTTKQEFSRKPPKSSTIATAQPANDLKNKTKVAQPASPTDNKPFKKKMQPPTKARKPTVTDDEDDDKVVTMLQTTFSIANFRRQPAIEYDVTYGFDPCSSTLLAYLVWYCKNLVYS